VVFLVVVVFFVWILSSCSVVSVHLVLGKMMFVVIFLFCFSFFVHWFFTFFFFFVVYSWFMFIWRSQTSSLNMFVYFDFVALFML